ncbi:sulfotransferase domain protein, partial [Teladorsagia circumcincta]
MILWLSQQLVLITLSVAIPVEVPQKSFPTAIIVGVKKAGTRALLEFLRLNPNIRAPGPEVHFFDKNYHKGLEWYRDKMPLTSGSQLTIEKSPAYFHSRTAAERIRALNPAMKIIIVVRDPVMRAISDYTQAASKRKMLGPMPSFEDMAVGDCAPWLKTNCSSKMARQFPNGADSYRRWRAARHTTRAGGQPDRAILGLQPVVTAEHFGVDPVKKFPCVRRPNGGLHCLGKTKGRRHPRVRPIATEAHVALLIWANLDSQSTNGFLMHFPRYFTECRLIS